jgi:hypothetical protein
MPVLNRGNDSFQNDLSEMYDALQQQRGALLDAVLDVQVGTRLLMALEVQRLEQQRGADDPRVASLRERAETILARANVLAVERDIASVRVPPVVKTGAIVQGRITDAQRRTAGRVSVRLINERGEPVAGVDAVEVDDAGFYAFVLQPETVKAIGADTKLTVALRDGEKQVVPAAAKPFTIAPGASAVQEVMLSTGELERLRLRVSDLTPPVADSPSRPPPVVAPTQPRPLQPSASDRPVRGETPTRGRQPPRRGRPIPESSSAPRERATRAAPKAEHAESETPPASNKPKRSGRKRGGKKKGK